MPEHGGDRATDDVAATEDYRARPHKRNPGRLEETNDTGGRAWRVQRIRSTGREVTDVVRVETVCTVPLVSELFHG